MTNNYFKTNIRKLSCKKHLHRQNLHKSSYLPVCTDFNNVTSYWNFGNHTSQIKGNTSSNNS